MLSRVFSQFLFKKNVVFSSVGKQKDHVGHLILSFVLAGMLDDLENWSDAGSPSNHVEIIVFLPPHLFPESDKIYSKLVIWATDLPI